MYNDDEARREWEETIKRKTEQVRKGWAFQFNGSVSLEDALVGVFAAASVKREIPRYWLKIRMEQPTKVWFLFLIKL